MIVVKSLVAPVVVGLVPAQAIVVRGGVDGDLVVQRAAAGVVELLHDVPGLVAAVLTVLGVGSDRLRDTVLDGPVLEEVGGAVVEAAEAIGFLGAVLDDDDQW